MNLLTPAVILAFLLTSVYRSNSDPVPKPATSSTSSTAEFQKLDAEDDAAQAEVDKWILDNKAQKSQADGLSDTELEQRIAKRFEPVRRHYEEFLKRYPDDSRGHLAYGNFLNDRQEERGAQLHWERALELDPTNSAIYNNLAGRYGESGPVEKAFEYFNKAIELSPRESAYYHNFGDVLFVLRKHAAEYYRINEQQVYSRCLTMYSNALYLQPQNFVFARDLAQTYYSLKPLPVDDALRAWTNALHAASQEGERQDVAIHLARVNMLAGHLPEARALLSGVTNEGSLQAKINLLKAIEQREQVGTGTSSAPTAK